MASWAIESKPIRAQGIIIIPMKYVLPRIQVYLTIIVKYTYILGRAYLH